MPAKPNLQAGAGLEADESFAAAGSDAILVDPALADAFCVVASTPYGRDRRRVFLSLHSAVQAVKRARERGLTAELVLCRLVPVQADLDQGPEAAR